MIDKNTTKKARLNQQLIADLITDQGFALVGFLSRQDASLGDWITPWLEKGFHADMEWITRNAAIRESPCSIESGSASIITMAYPYRTLPPVSWESRNPISNYAWGEDYHEVLKKKLKVIINALYKLYPSFKGRAFVDSAPIPEKIVAMKSGLGWIGKNSILINKKLGSYLFLAEIVCNLLFKTTPPVKNYCGSCRKCIDACPSKAIVSDGMIDSSNCVSYLTIEKRSDFSIFEKSQIDYHLFGCDICQQVCPWNKKSPFQVSSPFQCFSRWVDIDLNDVCHLTCAEYEMIKENSPIKRATLEGLKRNAAAVLENK